MDITGSRTGEELSLPKKPFLQNLPASAQRRTKSKVVPDRRFYLRGISVRVKPYLMLNVHYYYKINRYHISTSFEPRNWMCVVIIPRNGTGLVYSYQEGGWEDGVPCFYISSTLFHRFTPHLRNSCVGG